MGEKQTLEEALLGKMRHHDGVLLTELTPDNSPLNPLCPPEEMISIADKMSSAVAIAELYDLYKAFVGGDYEPEYFKVLRRQKRVLAVAERLFGRDDYMLPKDFCSTDKELEELEKQLAIPM